VTLCGHPVAPANAAPGPPEAANAVPSPPEAAIAAPGPPEAASPALAVAGRRKSGCKPDPWVTHLCSRLLYIPHLGTWALGGSRERVDRRLSRADPRPADHGGSRAAPFAVGVENDRWERLWEEVVQVRKGEETADDPIADPRLVLPQLKGSKQI
jgi:hypothetical protein